jgi:hypothetical protein
MTKSQRGRESMGERGEREIKKEREEKRRREEREREREREKRKRGKRNTDISVKPQNGGK